MNFFKNLDFIFFDIGFKSILNLRYDNLKEVVYMKKSKRAVISVMMVLLIMMLQGCSPSDLSFSKLTTPTTTHEVNMDKYNNAGWSSLEARRAHNPEVIGSNPVPATLFFSPDSSVGRAED